MNWGEIKTAVKQYLQNTETTFRDNLTLFARLAEEDIYRKVQLPFARELATLSVAIDDKDLLFPSRVLAVYSLAVIDPVTGEYSYLLSKDLAFLREAYPDPTVTGRPRYYTWLDEETMRLAPTPDAAYTAELSHFTQPDSISLNNDDENDNWLSNVGENALIFGILYHGYIYEKGDQDVIAAYKGQFDTALADLKLIAEGRQTKDTYRQLDTREQT